MQLIRVIHVLVVGKEFRRYDFRSGGGRKRGRRFNAQLIAAGSSQDIRHFRRAPSVAQVLQDLNEAIVRLTKDFLELYGSADTGAPRGRLEAKLLLLGTVLGDGRQLKEIAAENEGDSAKGFVGGFHGAGDRFQLVKKVAVHHRDLVNDQVSVELRRNLEEACDQWCRGAQC